LFKAGRKGREAFFASLFSRLMLKLLHGIKTASTYLPIIAIRTMSCCPSGSWGALIETAPEAYQAKGKVERRGDMDLYVVGSADGGKCVIWNYDIFGFNGGRSKMLCDIIAQNGFLVVMPDFYRDGKFQDPTQPGTVEFLKEYTQWSKLKKDVDDVVLPFAKELGATSFGAIGTCWGSYMVVRQGAYPEFKAGVSMHPSHSPISGFIGEEEKDLLVPIQCQQLFMPAGNDHANVKPGGLGEQILGNKLEIIEFPEMTHGWTTRGDVSKAAVNRDVKKAIADAIDFFKKHV